MKKPILSIFLFTFALPSFCTNYLKEANEALHQKDAVRAVDLLYKAETEQPNNLIILLRLAAVHAILHQYEKAAQYYDQALTIRPNAPNTHHNCGNIYSKFGQFEQAHAHYERAYTMLQDDTIKGGLFKSSIRLKQWTKASQLGASCLWWYDENIYGKTVLLDISKPGNGYGDGIQFMRYAQILAQAGARVLVKAPPPLIPLLFHAPYIAHVIRHDDSEPPHDKRFDICIASLLMTMKHVDSSRNPYVWGDPALIDSWGDQLKKDGNFKVGICWLSNYVQELFSGEIVPSPRSISLEQLALLALPGTSFYSLQKTDGPVHSPFTLHQFDADFDQTNGRFMDTAAVIMNMDLVITIDTSIAHLAAALGKPVWILLSCESDYRWFTHTERSTFYPTIRLFRQKNYGDWSSVIELIKIELQKAIA